MHALIKGLELSCLRIFCVSILQKEVELHLMRMPITAGESGGVAARAIELVLEIRDGSRIFRSARNFVGERWRKAQNQSSSCK